MYLYLGLCYLKCIQMYICLPGLARGRKEMDKVIRNTLYMFKFVWRADKCGLMWMLAFILYGALPTAVEVLLLKWMIDAISGARSIPYMLAVILGCTAVQILNIVLTLYIDAGRMQRVRLRTQKLLNGLLLDKMRTVDAESYDDPVFFDMLSKASGEADTRAELVINTVQSIGQSVVSFGVSVGLLAVVHPLLIAVSLLSGIFTAVLARKYNHTIFAHSEELAPVIRMTGYFKGIFQQRATAADIKQYGNFGKLILNHFLNRTNEQHALQFQMTLLEIRHMVCLMTISHVTITTIPYLYAGIAAIMRVVSIGNMTMMMTASAKISQNINGVIQNTMNLHRHSLYIENLRTVLEYQPRIEADTEGESLGAIESVEFERVSFRYPGSGAEVLHEVSFRVEKGEKLALVGINGAGKTTIVKLLLRFYDPQEGVVRINGRDIRGYSVPSLRTAMGSVFQEFQIYSLPISEFVSCLPRGEQDEGRIRDALARVGLLEPVEAGGGIHTEYSKYFDENGLVFSGGQMQKLAIARMLYKDSSLLILDEPSSALDPESEYEINQMLARAAEHRTVLLISHRLSTTKDADKIILIEEGRVQEQGTHRELMEQNGRYAYLFNLQASEYIG